jgi:transcriptional regulator with XRE-family HTH domain/tetratricopeptide (TPR) repeat protein
MAENVVDKASAGLDKRADGRVVLQSQQLKALRLRRGLSQEALADYCSGERLCVSIATIKRAESGKSLLYRTARHLAQAYEVSLESLLAVPDDAPGFIHPPELADTPADAFQGEDVFADDELATRTVVLLVLPDDAALDPARHEEANACVAQYGGTPFTRVDGKWVAVFGMPQAYRSDITRCVDCAGTLAGRWPDMRGPVVVGLGGWSKAGARLPDAILELGALHAAPAPLLAERALAATLADGYEVVFFDGDARFERFAGLRRGSSAGPAMPFVGRHGLLQQFKVILDDVQTTQCSQVVHVRGAAGIGKSRLVRECEDIARQWKFAHHQIAVLDFGLESRAAPWAQLARTLLDLPAAAASAAGPEEESRRLGERMRLGQSNPVWEMSLRALLGLPQAPGQDAVFAGMEHAIRRRRLAEALQALILRVAVTRPVVIVIEDIHWADAPFLDTYAELLALTHDAAVVWLTTSRHDNDPLDTHVRPHCGDAPLTVFDLPPLRQVEAEALALQHADADATHRQRCVELARGNALFLTQLLLSPPGAMLPESLRHLVQSQLDRLPALDRRALRAASAIGQQFPLDLLRDMLGDAGYSTVLPERANLLKPSTGGVGVFVHDLVMHCIYDAMAPSQRRFLHGRLAALYEGRDIVLWARHLDRAGDAGAPQAYLRAIREQLARHDYELAIELAEGARANPHMGAERYPLAMLAAEAAARSMRNEAACAGYAEARALARTDAERLDAMQGLAAVLNVLDRIDEEEALLDEALALAHATDYTASLAQLYYLKGNIRFPRGEFAAGRSLHERAFDYARKSGKHDVEARSLSGLGDSLYAEGRMRQANRVFDECLTLCRRHGLASIEASNLFMRGTTRIYLGDAEGALADALDSAALGRRVGNRRAEIVSRLTASWVLLAMGRLEEAGAEVGQGLAIARSMGAARFEPFLNECLARVSYAEGRRSLALEQIRDACAAVDRMKMHRFIGPWLFGTLALLSDDAAERADALARGERILAGGCVAHNLYRFRMSAAEIALLEGDAARARTQVELLRAATADDPCEWVAHPARIVDAYAAWLADPCDDTRVALRGLHRQSTASGWALTMPRLDALLRAL